MSKFVCSVVVVLVVIAVQMQEGNALHCWRCSSDSSATQFCNDPFNSELIANETQRKWAFVDCNVSNTPNLANTKRGACRKMKETTDKGTKIVRSCVFEDINAEPNVCAPGTFPEDAFCATCLNDACNGAGTFVPVALLTMASVAAVKLLIF